MRRPFRFATNCFATLILLPVLVMGLSLPGPVSAAEPGTVIFPFLKIGLGGRAPALGGAGTALTGGDVAAQWNPAAMAFLPDRSVTAQHTEWLDDVQLEYLGFGMRSSEKNAFGLAVAYLHMGAIETRDPLGNPTGGSFNPNDLMISCNVARRFTDRVAGGLNFKFVQEKLEAATAGAFAFDFGVNYRMENEKFVCGLVIQNFGQKAGFYAKDFPLPLTIRAGVAYQAFERVTFVGDAVKPRDGDLYPAFGLEVAVTDFFPVRVGYSFNRDQEQGFTAGAGFTWNELVLDYAYAPFGDLGQAHRLALSWQPGLPQPPLRPAAPRPPRVPPPPPSPPPPSRPRMIEPPTPRVYAPPAHEPPPPAAPPAAPRAEPDWREIEAPRPRMNRVELDFACQQAADAVAMGNYDRAIRIYLAILIDYPREVKALTELGELYARLGQTDLADYYLQLARAAAGL